MLFSILILSYLLYKFSNIDPDILSIPSIINGNIVLFIDEQEIIEDKMVTTPLTDPRGWKKFAYLYILLFLLISHL